jgi:hypothetical protein
MSTQPDADIRDDSPECDYLSKLEAYGQLERDGEGRGTIYTAVGVTVDA